MNRIYKINNPIEIFILGHKVALGNAMAKGFELLGTGKVYEYEEEEKNRIYHEGAIDALEKISKIFVD